MKTLIRFALLLSFGFGAMPLFAATEYYIQASVNDEKFIIDNEVYEAKTYCFNMDKGDPVIFVDGTPGICVSATLFNARSNQKCEVWCE